jgi:hypothetical protein
MYRFIRLALSMLTLTATFAVAALSWYGCVALKQVANAGAAATQAAKDLDATLKRVNGPTGTITETDKLLLALKSTTVHIDMAARHEDQQLGILDAQERQLFADLHGTAKDAQSTLTALTGTAQALTETVGEGKATLQATKPLISSLDAATVSGKAAIDSLNDRINDPHLTSLMVHLDATTGNIDGITADAMRVSDKATSDYLAPKPWYIKLRAYSSDFWDFAALLARHTP